MSGRFWEIANLEAEREEIILQITYDPRVKKTARYLILGEGDTDATYDELAAELAQDYDTDTMCVAEAFDRREILELKGFLYG